MDNNTCPKWKHKIRYRNYDDAKKGCEFTLGSKPHLGLPSVYRCKFCRGFHVGHKKVKK